MSNDKYEIIIYWSREDNAFVAEVPELPGCMAHGKTHESALRNAKAAIRLWIKTAMEFNDPIPQPKGRRFVAKTARRRARQRVQRYIAPSASLSDELMADRKKEAGRG